MRTMRFTQQITYLYSPPFCHRPSSTNCSESENSRSYTPINTLRQHE